ncbi:hypothetical protein [Nocardia brevicatena]|uniref:hypothetical protein n=1 Tax=Nocardia brevicatena TaxID=37327 RepID=UPI000308C18F|nr:hypothetical protein [Nocardia brevicatena]
MAISKGFRFPVDFKQAFPKGLLLMGPVGPAIKYNPDRNAVQEQKFDIDPKTGEGTKLPMWTATVTDPHEDKAKRASFEITFLSEYQPVPAGQQITEDMWFIELEGLTAEPRVMGQGEFKYLGYTFRATGIKGDVNTPKATTGKAAA